MTEQGNVAIKTYIFDIWTRMNGYDISMLDAKVVTDNTVDACTSIIKVIVGKHDQHRVFSLLALDKYGISPEEL